MTNASRMAVNAIFERIEAGRLDEALALCRERIDEDAGDFNALGLLGAILLKTGDFEAAEAALLKTIELEPAFPKPYEDLGALYLARNDAERAVGYFEKAGALNPGEASVFNGLAAALARLGRSAEAQAARTRYLALSPAAGALARAEELRKSGDAKKAEQICEDLLAKEPQNIDALRLLAVIASDEERHVIAEGLLRRIVKLAPDAAGPLADLGRFLGERNRYPEAVGLLQKAAALDPGDFGIVLKLADMLAIVGRDAEALAAYERCLDMKPDEPAALIGRAHMLRIAGRPDDAAAGYRKCISRDARIGDAWWHLGSMHGYRLSDDDIATMQAQLEIDDLHPDAAVPLRFALARAFEQHSDFSAAWQHYDKANALKRSLVKYDPVETEHLHDRLIQVFSADQFKSTPGAPPNEVTPVFIVGLPRSGSTLIEQILASHSRVVGGGELPYIRMISSAIHQQGGDELRYPEVITELDESSLTGLGRTYLHHAVPRDVGDRDFFTDKLPANFSHVGFIHRILPHARIIDARRHPMAACVANYRQYFAQGKNQSYDLTELAEYYLQYVRIMAHWDEVLPGTVLRVNYEGVVADLDRQVRRILDYCGLPFEQSCINFHQSTRPVPTASAEQVRQPIYDSAVDFWKNYEPYLDELREVLAPVL